MACGASRMFLLSLPTLGRAGSTLSLDSGVSAQQGEEIQGLQSISCWPRCAISVQMCHLSPDVSLFLYIKLILVFITCLGSALCVTQGAPRAAPSLGQGCAGSWNI